MMFVTGGVCDKNEGDGNGDSILSGFGSSSGSSTDETVEQEEFLDELSRQMTEHMLRDDEMLPRKNKLKATPFQPIYFNQNQGMKYEKEKEVKVFSKEKEYSRNWSGAGANGSGMRVVFLGESGSRSRSVGGTGVFIPHATNTLLDHHSRKKPAGRCSTVLIPERVLNSLKHHHERRSGGQRPPIAMFQAQENQMRLQHQETPYNNTADNYNLQHQESPSKTVVNYNIKNDSKDADDDELQLPQEWTY